jgi:hypothetical protein
MTTDLLIVMVKNLGVGQEHVRIRHRQGAGLSPPPITEVNNTFTIGIITQLVNNLLCSHSRRDRRVTMLPTSCLSSLLGLEVEELPLGFLLCLLQQLLHLFVGVVDEEAEEEAELVSRDTTGAEQKANNTVLSSLLGNCM